MFIIVIIIYWPPRHIMIILVIEQNFFSFQVWPFIALPARVCVCACCILINLPSKHHDGKSSVMPRAFSLLSHCLFCYSSTKKMPQLPGVIVVVIVCIVFQWDICSTTTTSNQSTFIPCDRWVMCVYCLLLCIPTIQRVRKNMYDKSSRTNISIGYLIPMLLYFFHSSINSYISYGDFFNVL